MKRAVELGLSLIAVVAAFALVGSEMDTWRGVVVLGLVVLGAVEVIVAARALADEGWTWRAGLHGLVGGAGVIAGIALAESSRWLVVAALTVGIAALRARFFPSSEIED